MRYGKIYYGALGLAAVLLLIGLVMDGPLAIWTGLGKIVTTENALITDYIQLAGPGAAFANAAIVILITAALYRLSGDPLNGSSLVGLGLMAGFSLFGKNFLNIWPILLGTWLYARSRKEPFAKYISVSLLATALAPMVSYIALDNGFGNLFSGIVVGIVIGFIMPPLCAYTFRIQNGMNLYNVGFACGLLAMLFVPVMTALGADPTLNYHWAEGYNVLFGGLLGAACVGFVLAGLFLCHRPPWAAWAGYRRLLKTSGRAPSDYLRMFGTGPVLINMGINGLIGLAFLLLLGGDLNGPTLGGLFTIMGFSAFGKHAGNIIPVMAGVTAGGFFFQGGMESGSLQLAVLFCTAMAPIAGYFGWQYGVLAGFLHSVVVLSTGSPVAGMNLYNNGFSAGLIAIVLYPTIIAIARHRKAVIQEEDYFDTFEHDEPQLPAPKHGELSEEREGS